MPRGKSPWRETVRLGGQEVHFKTRGHPVTTRPTQSWINIDVSGSSRVKLGLWLDTKCKGWWVGGAYPCFFYWRYEFDGDVQWVKYLLCWYCSLCCVFFEPGNVLANFLCIEVLPQKRSEVISGKYIMQYYFGAGASAAVAPLIKIIGAGWTFTICELCSTSSNRNMTF